MAKICKVEIQNFRSIRNLVWIPGPGLNCLIGPGDSGKSTILDAIDLCLGARRNAHITDVDFFGMDVTQPINITVTLSDLDTPLKSIETYGMFLRSCNPQTSEIEEEPHKDWPTVLTLNLRIEGDLEPVWSLISAQALAQGVVRNLSWKDRLLVSPTRLGSYSSGNLSWTRGSVLNKLTDERADVGAALVGAARLARASFGDHADKQLSDTLAVVTKTANTLGIPVGQGARALMDTHSTPFGDGAISLHNADGIPLRNLGTGSSRLLVAGLQRSASESASVLLVDEIEYGLEPHRLVRLLDSLGAKDPRSQLQVFMTTHSPVALRELNGNQLYTVRCFEGTHTVLNIGWDDEVQSTIRTDPEAFLSRSVIVCEGASEVGLLRGVDQFWSEHGFRPLAAAGVSLVDTGGGDPDRCFSRGIALQRLGYRVMVVVDSDKPPTPQLVQEFITSGGRVTAWRAGRALEDELFLSLPDASITKLLERAQELTEEGRVDAHIKTISNGGTSLQSALQEGVTGYSYPTKEVLGKASRIRKAGWFKSISKMQSVARHIVGPGLETGDPAFSALIKDLFAWAHAES